MKAKKQGLMTTVRGYVGRNPVGVMAIGVALVMVVGVMTMQGCSMADYIKVRVPAGVQRSIGVPSKITLREASSAFEKFKADVTRDSTQFAESIESAQFLSELFGSLLDTGLTLGQVGVENSGIPMGGLLSLGLGMLGGLALEKPGSQKRTTAEKMSSFNKGLTEGKEIALAAIKD